MSIITACTSAGTPADAAREVAEQLEGAAPKLVVFFASAKYGGVPSPP